MTVKCTKCGGDRLWAEFQAGAWVDENGRLERPQNEEVLSVQCVDCNHSIGTDVVQVARAAPPAGKAGDLEPGGG